MSEDLDNNPQRTWRCPACAFAAPTAEALAAHVQLVHIGPAAWVCPGCRFEAATAGELVVHVRQVHPEATAWPCPARECSDREDTITDAMQFTAHLERHILQERTLQARTCRVRGCSLPAKKGHLCWTHYRAALREKRARKGE